MLLGEECPYKTPCGWCYRLNAECKKKPICNTKKSKAFAKMEENSLNSAGEYAAEFSCNEAANGKGQI